jgi:predicted nucleic acid-binding protein
VTTTLVDTSAFITLLDDADPRFGDAFRWLDDVVTDRTESLVTHSYVVVETIAVIQRRFGVVAVRTFVDHLLPVCTVRFVDEPLHERATAAYLAGLDRQVSFVDRVSFELMRNEGIAQAFAFDPDFSREGFETVPVA